MDHIDADSAYFTRRASEEQAAAEQARDQKARQLHIELAERYSARAERPEPAVAEKREARTATPPSPAEFRILR